MRIKFNSIIIALWSILFMGSAQAQRYSHSEPDYVLFAIPTASGGLSLSAGDVSSSYSRKTGLSYNVGFGLAMYINKFSSHLLAIPGFGVEYNSTAINFDKGGGRGTTIQFNSVNLTGCLSIPFIQLVLTAGFPISAYSALHLSPDDDNVVTIHPKDLRITLEPRVMLYYVFLTSKYRAEVLIPYISAGLPLMNVLRNPFSLGQQSFINSPDAISTLKKSSIVLGVGFGFEIARHYQKGDL